MERPPYSSRSEARAEIHGREETQHEPRVCSRMQLCYYCIIELHDHAA